MINELLKISFKAHLKYLNIDRVYKTKVFKMLDKYDTAFKIWQKLLYEIQKLDETIGNTKNDAAVNKLQAIKYDYLLAYYVLEHLIIRFGEDQLIKVMENFHENNEIERMDF